MVLSVVAGSAGLVGSSVAQTQGTINLEDVQASPGQKVQVTMDVSASDVAGYQANVTWDSSVLSLVKVQGTSDFNAPTTNNGSGFLFMTQSKTSGSSNPDLAKLTFKFVGSSGDSSPLSFVQSDTSVTDSNGNSISISYSDGSVSNPAGTINLPSKDVSAGQKVQMTMNVSASDVAGYQANVTFDSSVLNLVKVEGTNDFNAPTTNNGSGFVFMTQSKTSGTNNPDLATLTFKVVGSAGDSSSLSFVQSDTSVTDSNGNSLNIGYSDGSATVPTSSADFQIASITPAGADSTIDKNENETYSVTIDNTGSGSGTQTVSVSISNGSVTRTASQSVSIAAGNTKTVTLTPDLSGFVRGSYTATVSTNDDSVSGTLSVVNPRNRNRIDGEITDAQLSPINNAQNVSFTITYIGGSGSRASDLRLVDGVKLKNIDPSRGDVEDSVGQSGYVDNPTGIDKYFIDLPNFGDGTQFRITTQLPGFKAFDGTTEALEPGTSDTQNIRLTRRVVPAKIEIKQPYNSALADGDDQIVFDIQQIYGNRTGAPIDFKTDIELDLEDVTGDQSQIQISSPNTTLNSAGNNDPFTVEWDPEDYGPNNPLRIVATSTDAQAVTFNFTAVDNRSALDINPDGSVERNGREKRFVISGEGNLQGRVVNDFNTNPIEDASVWVVTRNRYDANLINMTVDLDDVDDNIRSIDADTNSAIDSGSAYIRLVDNSTGTVIPPKMYDVRTQDDSATGTKVRKIEELDTNDQRQGGGFYVEARSGETVNFAVARLKPQNFKVDISLTAENASDQRLADGATANFTRVTDTDGASTLIIEDGDTLTNFGDPDEIDVPTDTLQTDVQAVASPSTNLTVGAAVQLSERSDTKEIQGANYADTPGFVNSYGQDTGGTNDLGQFALNRLPTDFQIGGGYVGIATKAGFTSDFLDATITEDGDVVWTEAGETTNFHLEPVDPSPSYVNITNFGLHPPLADTGGSPDFSKIEKYDDMSDEFNQTVPRDGSVDVIKVTTRSDAGGALLNASVDLSIPDDATVRTKSRNFTGQIVGVLGGELESQTAGDAGVFHTGDTYNQNGFNLSEGEAIVLLETDETRATLDRADRLDNSGPNEPPTNETGIFAQLKEDAGATDFTNKEFLGVIQFRTGEMSGLVTDENNRPVQATVYTRSIVTPPGVDNLAIERNGNTYTIQRVRPRSGSRPPRVIEEVTGLSADQLRQYDFEGLDSVTTEVGVDFVTLLTDTSSTKKGRASYTLSRVPTVGPEPDSGSRGVLTQFAIRGISEASQTTGTSTLEGTNTNRTGTANVEIKGAIPSEFELSNPSTTDITVEQNGSISVTVDVTNEGDVTSTETISLSLGGTVFATKDVQLAALQTKTVTLTVDDVTLSPGDYDFTIQSPSDQISGNLTVEQGGNGANWWDEYTNSNGVATFDGLTTAVQDYENGELTFDRLVKLVKSYENGTPVDEL